MNNNLGYGDGYQEGYEEARKNSIEILSSIIKNMKFTWGGNAPIFLNKILDEILERMKKEL